ncbi:MAG TPA: cell envelope biogenesis protein OmpA, partial [Actinomycetota bacterium]|nr:cell envelope biogenesis protein OmpA [Actinomycetota bacterium]
SNDASASFECALDDPAAWTSCDTPYLVEGLLPGQHEMLIRAVNALGNADATPVVHRWTVTAPDTTIHTGPPASTVSTTANFTFSSNDPLATFECSLDGESFGSCDTPHLIENLLPGNHELLVRARNDAGTVDPSAASYRWTVKPMPDTAIINRPADPTDSTSATFTFTSNLPGVTFECALDEAADSLSFSPCGGTSITYNNLIFGEHEFAVRARDAEGNVDPTPATWGWDVQTAAPPVLINSGPDVTTESRSATFDFGADGRGIRYECSLDGGAFSLCVSPKTYNGLPIGPHTFAVRVLVPDEAPEPTEALYEWTVVENTPPETNIVFGPPDPSYNTDPEGTGPIATFAFESNEAPVTFECALDSAPFTECPDPSEFTGLTPGQHILRVRAVDLALNVDPTPARYTWTVVLDSTAPVTTIDTAETVVVEGQFETLFTFSANEPGSTFECSLDTEPFEQCESPMEYSDLTPGQHRFRVRAIDLAGNIEQPPVTHVFDIGMDATPPQTTIHSGPDPTVPDDWASFEFSSNEADATFECAIDGEPFEECFNPAQYVELEPGEHTFQVRALDSSLNPDPTPATWTWTYLPATPTPETTIVSTPPNPQTTPTAVFQFSSSGPEIEFECALDAE